MKQNAKSYTDIIGDVIPAAQMIPLKSHSFNGYNFTPGLKIIWNWTSRNSEVPYVRIGIIFQYQDKVYFTDSTRPHDANRTIICTEFIPFLVKLDIRPYKTNQ